MRLETTARIALGCALLGLAASTAAAYVHYHLLFDPHYASFCDVNGTFNCSQVYLSRFGTALGVPVALLGAIWFALATVVALAGFAGPPIVRESVPGYQPHVSAIRRYIGAPLIRRIDPSLLKSLKPTE